MAKVIWSGPAIADLKSITRYIARDNRDAALRVGNGLIHLASVLGSSPHLGRVYETSPTEIRVKGRGSYRMFYKILDDARAIEVLRVIHGSRQEPSFNVT